MWGLFGIATARRWRLGRGTLGAVFLTGYGLFRFTVERYRQPDAQFRGPGDPLGTAVGIFTMGQVLSGLMILAGLALLGWRWRTGSAHETGA